MNTRISLFDIPFLLGFDEVERTVDDIMRGTNDSYPPYNISQQDDCHYDITLAVAGFDEADLQLSLERNQLIIRGKKADAAQEEEAPSVYLHRGIAARQFERRFVLADGIEVESADLKNGLLVVLLKRSSPQENVRIIEINQSQKPETLPETLPKAMPKTLPKTMPKTMIDAPEAKGSQQANLKAVS